MGKNELALTAFYLFSCTAFGQQVTLHAPPGSSLQKMIGDAQRDHLTSFSTRRIGFTARAPAGPDEVLNESVVVLAHFKGKTISVGENGIITYSRFSVSRRFNTRKKSPEDGFPKRPRVLPAEVAPPARSELLLNHVGGTAVVDGITVTSPDSFPLFVPGQTYCLFLEPSSGVEGYALYYGPSAVYRVDGAALVPANSGPDNLIQADLRARFKMKLIPLQTYLTAMLNRAGQ